MKRTFFSLMLVLLFSSTAMASKVVSVYNWTEYIPLEILKQFTKETGIKVIYSTYESNETMYTKLKLAGGKGYDIIIPSTYFVSRMIKQGMLAPLDYKQIPNLRNLESDLLNKDFDAKNKYSIPYVWGGTGIATQPGTFKKGYEVSWADLWDPKFAGRVLLQDDVREVLGVGLLRLGYSINSSNPKELEKAYQLMKTLMPAVRVINSDNPKMPILNEEVEIGMLWNGEAWLAWQDGGEMDFHWPKEGGIMWMDSLVIPKDAANKENAHKFINFILRPDIAKQVTEYIGYVAPNKKAVPMLSKELRENQAIFPPKKIMDKSVFQTDVDAKATLLYEEYWQKLKADN